MDKDSYSGYEPDGIAVFRRMEEAKNKGRKLKNPKSKEKIDEMHSGKLDTQLFKRKLVKKDGYVILTDDTHRGW